MKPRAAPDVPDFDLLLCDVARSFYLTIKVLPKKMRRPVALAYLLARAADSVADMQEVPCELQIQLLTLFRRLVQSVELDEAGVLQFIQEVPEQYVKPGEQRLIQALLPVFNHYLALPQADRVDVRHVVMTLTEGMLFDLDYFDVTPNDVRALSEDRQIQRYTYLVAGCVGEFWTRLMLRHFSILSHDAAASRLQQQGIRFGQALQFTNILRDIYEDAERGRCYLPIGTANTMQWPRQQLFSQALVHSVECYLKHAVDCYQDAECYLLTIPRRHWRLRLAALWPQVIGLYTLTLLAQNPRWFYENKVQKIKRQQVYRMLFFSLFMVFSNTLSKRWLQRLRAVVLAQLALKPGLTSRPGCG